MLLSELHNGLGAVINSRRPPKGLKEQGKMTSFQGNNLNIGQIWGNGELKTILEYKKHRDMGTSKYISGNKGTGSPLEGRHRHNI